MDGWVPNLGSNHPLIHSSIHPCPSARNNPQPELLEARHPRDVLAFAADGNVVGEHAFQLETSPAVEIDVPHVHVAGMDVNLVRVANHEGVVKKSERRALADALALQRGFADEFF